MKKYRFQILRGVMLCLVLFAFVVPFAVSAQTQGAAAGKMEGKASAESEEITLTIEGTIQGGRFFFKEKTIQFDTLNKYYMPSKDFIVNGKKWEDLSKPFKLDASPLRMAHPDILEIRGPYSAYLRHVNDNRLEVTFKLTPSLVGDQLSLTLASLKNPVQPSAPASGNGR